MPGLPPITTAHLFPLLDRRLLDLLQSLSPADWDRQTIAPRWKVKDVAAHLLDGNIRALAMLRDNYFGEKPGNIESYQDLVDFLNGLNADWVKAMRRVSPGILTELLAITGKAYCDYMASLPPFEQAAFSVAWAGEQVSENWFHVARDYTEKWHHQQQIRLAVGKEQALYTRELYYPYLDTSMRAMPHHYRAVPADPRTLVQITVTGEAGGSWYLLRESEKWVLQQAPDIAPDSVITIAGEVAWRLFTKGISRQAAEEKVSIAGRQELGEPVFSVLAVMA